MVDAPDLESGENLRESSSLSIRRIFKNHAFSFEKSIFILYNELHVNILLIFYISKFSNIIKFS